MIGRALLVIAVLAGAADAGPEPAELDADQFVLLNASTSLDLAQIARMRRVLDARGMLAKLPAELEATLDGRNVLIADLDAIREAFANVDYAAALELIQANEERILANAGGGDPIPALAQLCELRGLIASAQDAPDEAVRQFRAALRFNPAWSPDPKLGSSPTIRKLVKRARRELRETGRLRVEAQPEGATVQIDGGKPQPIADAITLPAGIHLVVVAAPAHATYAEIVDIDAGDTERFAITLDPETRSDRAAKLVDATVAAPPGKARLSKVTRLAKYTRQTRYLVVEGMKDDSVQYRVYDIDAIKVSQPIELDGTETSAEITAKVMAALDPDNMVDPSAVMVVERQRDPRWYERWYVWAGVGAVLGGGVLGYHYATREPTAIRF